MQRGQGERTVRSTRLPEDIRDLLDLTYDADPAVRRHAARQLCPCGVKRNFPEVWDRIIALAGDDDVKVRSHIVHVLCDGSPREREPEVVRALEARYDESDPGVRRRVRKVLAIYRRKGTINVL